MSSHYFKMWKWLSSTSVDLVMVLTEWAGKSEQSGCICHLFINSLNTSVVAAVAGIKCQWVVLSVHPRCRPLCTLACANVGMFTCACKYRYSVHIERSWLHAGVHMHACTHGLSQDPGPSPSSFWPDPAVNSAALAIHTYHLPNAFPVVSPNARRRETPRNAQSQRDTACEEPSRVTAQGQGGGRLRGRNTTSPSGKAREGGGCGGGGKVHEGFGRTGKGGRRTSGG